MDTAEFREEMARFTERIISSKENTSDGQWIDFGKIQDDFHDLATKYLDIIW